LLVDLFESYDDARTYEHQKLLLNCIQQVSGVNRSRNTNYPNWYLKDFCSLHCLWHQTPF